MHKRLRDCYRAVIEKDVTNVTDLNLKFTPLDSEGAQHLSLLLPFYSSLISLRLWKTRIGPIGCSYLSQAFPYLPLLRILSIEDNAIGPDGIKSLAQGLRAVSGLKEFFLHSNNLNSEGGLVLASILPDLPRLKSLTVDENNIEDQAAIELIRVLSDRVAELRLLGLGHNQLTERTARVMIMQFPSMRFLRKVTFGGAAIVKELQLELCNSLPEITIDF